ncbi:hypothetical protein L195_g064238, partial [Trifolium pratense]
KCPNALKTINKKLLSQCCSLSEGSASLSEPHQWITCSWRAAASYGELFATRSLSEGLASAS